MQYALAMESPDYEAMVTWLRAYAVTMHQQRHALASRHGRTSVLARAAQEQCNRMDRVIAQLVRARMSATAERATQSTETPARNVSDDIGMVVGRPRNDPRDARQGGKRK